MNYTLHQLHIFYKISINQSITRTAEEMFLTQPAISIQLKNFQDQFSIPLTEVVGRQLYITDFGKEIAEAAKKIIEEVEAINYKTLSFSGELAGKLKLSIASTGKYVMPYFLSGFMDLNSGVELVMDVTNKSQVIRSMELNEVDFALVSVVPEKLKVNHVELMGNQLFLIGNRSSDLDEPVSIEEIFQSHPMIYREEGSATRNAMEQFIIQNDYPVRKKIELTSNEAVKQSVQAGLGYSIMPLIGIKNELQNNSLQIIPVMGLPLKTTWRLIWLQSKRLSPVAAAYLEYLKSQKDVIIKNHFKWASVYNA